MKDLVYGLTSIPGEGQYPLYQRPAFRAVVVALVLVAIDVIFW